MLEAHGEVERLRAQAQSNELMNQKNSVSVDNRKLELERQFLELTKNKQNELEEMRGLDGGAQRKF